jgi:hypothetical protein
MGKNMVIERFLNAALYFSEKTKQLDTIKLYKLLFLADRNSIKKTGQTITESTYRKIKPWGPVPKEIKALVDGMAAGDERNPSISRFLKVEKQGRNTHISFTGTANLSFFTKEERNVLEKLAVKYKHTTGKRIAHGVHEMRGIKEMDWEKDFLMDIFLSPREKAAVQEEKAIADKFRVALEHA